MSRALCFFVLWCVLLLTITPSAQIVQAKHSRVELVAATNTLVPNRPLLVGVHFVLENGWHIYWINPGDSGQPPVFNWQLPPGFSAGEVAWPRPQRLHPNPQIVDYGYSKEVLLLVPMRTPPVPITGPSKIGLEMKWLICREVCIPDHANLQLSLRQASNSGNATPFARLFSETEKLLPKPPPARWKAKVEWRPENFVLSIHAAKPVGKAEFFPLEPGQIENAAPQILQPGKSGLRLILRKSDLLLKPIPVLRGVLVLGGVAYRIEAPVIEVK